MSSEYDLGNLVARCAHLSVDYRTEILPRGGTFGYWACRECGRRFTPILNSLSDGRTTQPFFSSTDIAYPNRYPQPMEASLEPHRIRGADWERRRAQIAASTNWFSFDPPQRTPEEQAFADALGEQIAREGMTLYGDTRYDSMDQRYPQEIEEPSPAPSWWSRFMEWLG